MRDSLSLSLAAVLSTEGSLSHPQLFLRKAQATYTIPLADNSYEHQECIMLAPERLTCNFQSALLSMQVTLVVKSKSSDSIPESKGIWILHQDAPELNEENFPSLGSCGSSKSQQPSPKKADFAAAVKTPSSAPPTPHPVDKKTFPASPAQATPKGEKQPWAETGAMLCTHSIFSLCLH